MAPCRGASEHGGSTEVGSTSLLLPFNRNKMTTRTMISNNGIGFCIDFITDGSSLIETLALPA